MIQIYHEAEGKAMKFKTIICNRVSEWWESSYTAKPEQRESILGSALCHVILIIILTAQLSTSDSSAWASQNATNPSNWRQDTFCSGSILVMWCTRPNLQCGDFRLVKKQLIWQEIVERVGSYIDFEHKFSHRNWKSSKYFLMSTAQSRTSRHRSNSKCTW